MDINPFSNVSLASIFPQSVDCLFVLLMFSFAVQKLFSVCGLIFYSSVFLAQGKSEDISEKIFIRAVLKNLLPMFSFRICTFWGLTFRSLIHFEFIPIYGVRRWSSFIFLHLCPALATLFWRLSLPHFIPLFPL